MERRTYAEALHQASAFFRENGREETAARFLLCGLADWTSADLMLHLREEMPASLSVAFADGVRRHAAGEPIQYIIGYEIFCGRKFLVSPEVLIPRPETEELVLGVKLRMEKHFPNQKEIRVLDIGTGSGAIAVSLALGQPHAAVTATDIAEDSLRLAEKNAALLGAKGIDFRCGDLFAALKETTPPFDVIVSNPPYISRAACAKLDDLVKKHEPMRALDGGVTGLDFYRRIIAESPQHLRPDGLLAFEIGADQGAAVKGLLAAQYPSAQIEVVSDINGKERMVYCLCHQTARGS